MNNRTWVENMIGLIIVLNIIVLTNMFFIPRIKFMTVHWNLSPEALMETRGALDTPNQFIKTYKVANKIRNVTQEDSIILMPDDNWEFGSNRSVMIQRLYPRKIYFLRDKKFLKSNYNLGSKKFIYEVGFQNHDTELCFKKDAKTLGNTGFVICESNIFN